MPLTWALVTMGIGLIVMTVLVMLAEVLLHYLPWSRLIGHKVPPPPWSYVAGLVPILAAYSVWMLLVGVVLEVTGAVEYALVGTVMMVLAIWTLVAAAGLSVILSYALDLALGRRMEQRIGPASE